MTTEIATTDTTATTPTPSLEDMLIRADELHAAANQAQIDYEAQLLAIGETHGRTFVRDGQHFQIRHRQDSVQGRPITYLCALKVAPKEWLKGPKKKAVDAPVPALEELPSTGETVTIE